MTDSNKKLRGSAKGRFTRKLKDYTKYSDDGEAVDILVTKFQEVKDAWFTLETAHDDYMVDVEEEEKVAEEEWIHEPQQQYNDVVKRMTVLQRTATRDTTAATVPSPQVDDMKSTASGTAGASAPSTQVDDKKSTTGATGGQPLQLEKIKLPYFNGSMSTYGRFKYDFQKYVQPTVAPDAVTYTLRSCLSKEPAHCVRNIDDDVTEMWKCLDEKYADASTVADVIVDKIKRTRPFKDEENKRFVEFVDDLEDCYNDLRKLGLEKEITTSSAVSMVEKKLTLQMQTNWARSINCPGSTVDKADKFPSLLTFLRTEKKTLEYRCANLRCNTHDNDKAANHADVTEATNEDKEQRDGTNDGVKYCLFHTDSDHYTGNCETYLSKPVSERLEMLKRKGACWACLRVGHLQYDCTRRRMCGINGCRRRHHTTLHNEKSGSVSACYNTSNGTCLLQLQRIASRHGHVNVLWDNAASVCFITYAKAYEENLKGTKVELSIVKVGGKTEIMTSDKYKIPLRDVCGNIIFIDAYGIDKITSEIKNVDISDIASRFVDVDRKDIERPSGGVDILIGYEYAGYHPVPIQRDGHLLLLENRFGKCAGGSHRTLSDDKKDSVCDVHVNHVNIVKVDDFYNIENLGVECSPRCGGCKCGKCAIGTKDYSLKEERELNLIESKLTYDDEQCIWTAEYPWIEDPKNLPNNYKAAMGMLRSTEKRLGKNATHALVYQEQIDDMVARGVAEKLTKEELREYRGPVHYISHHEVLKPDSKSTPVRIVFNSSANYMGHTLNEYWAKGPDLLNNLLGVLIRFRENDVAVVGDIKKMYHSVKIGLVEQHTHRFLWRNMNTDQEPDVYIVKTVSFGDKPAGTIATVALRKTAEMNRDEYPEAADAICSNTYMDDIIDSVDSIESAKRLTEQIESMIGKGGFKIKVWTVAGENADGAALATDGVLDGNEKVLGVWWNPVKDEFQFKVKLNFSTKRRKIRMQPDLIKDDVPEGIPNQLTKRMILSQVNSIYDPLGLAGPFTVRAKIMMRRLWGREPKLDWDEPIPDDYRKMWIEFFRDLFQMETIEFKRCVRPADATGKPSLVTFSDGSDNAYGACAYARWECADGRYESRLIASKNRLSPLKKMSIDRIELSGAVLNKRLKVFVEKESRYDFDEYYHIVDSQIVRAMIQKETYGFNTFAATRIGEIQGGTNADDWYWIGGEHNVADWITRGKKPEEIGDNSLWQKGPDFLKLPVNEWPVSKSCGEQELPDTIKIVMTTTNETRDTLAERINIGRHSTYTKLIRVTARVLAMYEVNAATTLPSFSKACRPLTTKDLENAEQFWINEVQKSLIDDMRDGKYRRLCPRLRDDGIIVVGGRAERWMQMSYNNEEVVLLPHTHRFSLLYAEYIHSQGHYGVATTASKIRAKYWIVRVHQMVKGIKFNCITCKKLDKNRCEQVMGKLPEDRLKPSPAWYATGIDLFGPFKIKDEVKKRTVGKAYGVLFNCMSTRAVYADVAADYSMQKFMLVLRRFVSLNGYPGRIVSDNGTQLAAASEELRRVAEQWDWTDLQNFGATNGTTWEFTTPDAPWQNGCTEALVKSVKRAITTAIGDSVLTFSELQTVFFEAANLVNERPIGRHPTSPDDGSYLCPNDLLLGRATSRVPSGPFLETVNPSHRHEFVQKLVTAFWKKWTRDLFPSLIIRQKWHTERRNLMIGDIVLIEDSNHVRGQWKLGKVSGVNPGMDGKVRRVQVQYKNTAPGEAPDVYRGSPYVVVERPIQKLVVVVPADDDDDEIK